MDGTRVSLVKVTKRHERELRDKDDVLGEAK